MITQTAAFRIDAAREAEAIAALTELAKAVETNEPGVLAYIPHKVAGDPTQIVFFEVYADEAAMKNHGQQPHLEKLGRAVRHRLVQAVRGRQAGRRRQARPHRRLQSLVRGGLLS